MERSADLVGVAGGDGTQDLVAGIAAGHGIPFVVISAGTRNHFALARAIPARFRGFSSHGIIACSEMPHSRTFSGQPQAGCLLNGPRQARFPTAKE
jgi:hypothetical protein